MLITKNSSIKTNKLPYGWQFRTHGQCTSSEMLIHSTTTTTSRWRPHSIRWCQKRIIKMTLKVGSVVSVHGIGCSRFDPYRFPDTASSCVTFLAEQDLCIIPIIHNMIVLYSICSATAFFAAFSWIAWYSYFLPASIFLVSLLRSLRRVLKRLPVSPIGVFTICRRDFVD